MKAIVYTQYGPPEVLKAKELPRPSPKDNQVLIHVRATTVTVADYRVRSFDIPKSFYIPARFALGITGPRNQVLGAELAGDIEAVGKNVTKFKVGDSVFASTLIGMGGYAEYKCIDENGPIALKPNNLSYEEAAAVPIGACTALNYLRQCEIKAGKKVLVYGASGSVGTYAVQLAKHFGAEVTGVCSGTNIEIVKSLGADKVLDYRQQNFYDQLDKYDIFFVAIDKIPFSIFKEHIVENGFYCNITLILKSFEMMLASKIRFPKGGSPGEKAGELEELRELIESRKLKVVVDRRYNLDDIVEAHRYVATGRKKGNVVVTV
jgi:NADPH:quinone reductase-like Zn-dependent oxidoreductase